MSIEDVVDVAPAMNIIMYSAFHVEMNPHWLWRFFMNAWIS